MTQAYVCDAVRTPIGRYAGGLSPVRADDLAAIPMAELMRRNTNMDWSKIDDVYWLRQSGRRGQPQCRAWRCCWQGSCRSAGRHGQPALRVGHGGGQCRRPGDPL